MINLLSVIDNAQAAENSQELFDYFVKLAKSAGFDAAYITELQKDYVRHNPAQLIHSHSFTQSLLEEYFDRGLLETDPVLGHVPNRVKPFQWSELENLKDQNERSVMLWSDLFHSAGYCEGLVIPLHGPRGTYGAAGLISSDKHLSLSPEEVAAMQMAAIHVFTRHLDFHRNEFMPNLSPRETEVLKWVAAGKSNSVIGDILTISDHTVDSLLRRVYRKLGVTSRAAAVMRAAQWGILTA